MTDAADVIVVQTLAATRSDSQRDITLDGQRPAQGLLALRLSSAAKKEINN
jgi:hypothetical protein